MYQVLVFLSLNHFRILGGHFKFGQIAQKWQASVVTFAVTPGGEFSAVRQRRSKSYEGLCGENDGRCIQAKGTEDIKRVGKIQRLIQESINQLAKPTEEMQCK